MYAKGLGSLDIPWTVVEEECLRRNKMLALNHSIEELGVGLHRPTLVALVGSIKIISKGVSLTVEFIAHHPRHHIGIGVGEQYNAITALAQFLHLLEIALRHITAISFPRMTTLLPCEFAPHKHTEFAAKVLVSDFSSFEVAEYTLLGVGVESLGGIF